MLDVVTIGAATLDIFIKSKDFSIETSPSSPTGAYLSIPFSHKAEMDYSLLQSGGGATNAAVSFSRLGLQAACISLLGNDHFGNQVLDELREDGVHTQLLSQKPQEKTDFSVILVGPDGGRTVLTNRGTTRLESGDIFFDKLKTIPWFYITSLEGNLSLLEQIFGFAAENNIKISLNPGSRELKQSAQLFPLLPHVDFLLLNRHEAETLTQEEFQTSAFWDKLISTQSKIIAVTNGREGAYVISATESHFSPIINAFPVDETGAGDSFGSAFVAGYIRGQPLSQCLLWGMHNAASVVSCFGAKTGLLSEGELNHNLKKA